MSGSIYDTGVMTLPEDPQHQQTAPPVVTPYTPDKPGGTSVMDTAWRNLPNREGDGSVWSEIGRKVGLGTRDVVEGLSGLPTAALDVATWPARAFQRAIGIETDAPSTMRQKALDAIGLPTAETPAERAISTVNQGASAALAGGGLGTATGVIPMAPTVANAARLAVQGGVGALAGKTAAESDYVPGPLKPTVDLAVNLLAAKGVDVGANLAAKGVNAATGQMGPVYDAFVRSGVTPRLLGTVAGGEAGQSAEAALSRVPFASSQLRPVQQQTLDEFGQSVDRTAGRLDPNMQGVTGQTTGEALQDAARQWRDVTFPAQQAAVWTPLNQRLAGAAVSPSGYRQALDDVTTQLSLPATQRALTPDLALRLRLALARDVPQGGAITWDQAQRLRSLIGQTMGVPEISQSVGMDVLRRAYAGIAGDMRTTAAQHGQDRVFDAANQVSTEGHAFLQGPLSKVISKNNPAQETISPEQATRNMLNGGSGALDELRTRIPGAADTLAAYNLRQASTAKPSVAAAYDDTSTGSFLTNINRMRQNSPGGYDALYNTPSVRQQLEDLSTMAGRLRATERHLNTSGTAEQLGWMGYLKGIYEAASEGKIGKTLGATVIPPVVGVGAGGLMTSPLVTRYAAARPAQPPMVRAPIAGLLSATPELLSGQ